MEFSAVYERNEVSIDIKVFVFYMFKYKDRYKELFMFIIKDGIDKSLSKRLQIS